MGLYTHTHTGNLTNNDNINKASTNSVKSTDIVKEKKTYKDTNGSKVIRINVGFAFVKIVAVILIILLLAAKTMMTVIKTKESISETESGGIASLAEIDVQSTLSEDETYSTVTITSNYAITQIEVSEEDYNEDLEEESYTFIVEEDWEVTEEGLVLTKNFTENIDKAYRLTFEDETYTIEEIIVTGILENTCDVESEDFAESGTDEEGPSNYDDVQGVSTTTTYLGYAGSFYGSSTSYSIYQAYIEDEDGNKAMWEHIYYTSSGSFNRVSYDMSNEYSATRYAYGGLFLFPGVHFKTVEHRNHISKLRLIEILNVNL